jgi:muconolactone delta-isomerase
MRFMASFVFRADATFDKIRPLVPAEQARVAELTREGVVAALYLSADMRSGWIVFHTDSAEAAHAAMESLPLHVFMDATFTPLLDAVPKLT